MFTLRVRGTALDVESEGRLLYVYSVCMVTVKQIAVLGACDLYSVSMVTERKVALHV